MIKQLVYLLASVQRVYTQVQTSTETNARITIPSTLPSVKDDSKASGTNNKAEEDCNWIVLGLKQVLREVKKGGVKLVLLAPDTETSSELDKQLATLASACFDRNVPILYALSRRVLGKAVLTGLRQAAVAITNIDCTSIQPVNIHPPIPNPPVYPYKGLSLSAYYSIVYNQLLTVPPSTLADAFGEWILFVLITKAFAISVNSLYLFSILEPA